MKKRNDDCIIEITILSRELKEKDIASPIYNFNGNLTSPEILGLFDPSDIVLKHSFSPDSYSIQIDIQTTVNDHPVLKYFQQKAIISYDGKIYEFGLIPNLGINVLCTLNFEEYNSIYDSPILHLESCKRKDDFRTDSSNFIINTTITYQTEFIYTINDIKNQGIDLEVDYVIIDFLYGKTAVEELRKIKYYQGVKVYKKKETK